MAYLIILNKYANQVIRGCQGPYLEVLDQWRRGELFDRESTCEHSHEDCQKH